MADRVCKRCGQTKAETDFSRADARGTLRGECKACRAATKREQKAAQSWLIRISVDEGTIERWNRKGKYSTLPISALRPSMDGIGPVQWKTLTRVGYRIEWV